MHSRERRLRGLIDLVSFLHTQEGASLVDVRRIKSADVPLASRTLAEAFAADPVTLWPMGGRRRVADRLDMMFHSLCSTAVQRPDHEIHVAGEAQAVAFWHPPDRWRLTTRETLAIVPVLLRVWRYGSVRGIRLTSAMEKAHPAEPHYYLEFIGTTAAARGTGAGATLMRDMLDRCDRDGVPAYLENSNPRNHAFYSGHGFRTRGSIDVPGGCPPLVPMWREPAS